MDVQKRFYWLLYPLTKTFDQSNQKVFNALQLMNLESSQGKEKYPYIILLDEANLSQVEFYWADFMSVCDNFKEKSEINLGEGNILEISKSLRFLATINNDFTTDTLSPRLVDRAWVITLPETQYQKGESIEKGDILRISWNDFCNAFECKKVVEYTPDVKSALDSILKHFRGQYIDVSPRTRKAISEYWSVAQEVLEKDQYQNSQELVALDYAVSQKLLPKIEGSGDEFEQWLKELRNLCNSNYLQNSVTILDRIIEQGQRQMKYYKFF